MSTTYLVGAGVNRGVVGPDGREPPLTGDLLRFALGAPKAAHGYVRERLRPLLEHIERLWHLTPEDLVSRDFDLEECFTGLELSRREAAIRNDAAELGRVSRLEYQLSGLVAESLAEIDYWLFFSEPYRELGRRLYSERAAILTFNYDGLLEAAIEDASPAKPGATGMLRVHYPDRGIHIEENAYSPRQWNRLLAYRVRFDEVASPEPGNRKLIPGETFYPTIEGDAEPPPFLKLHGSLGWYYRTGYSIDGTAVVSRREEKPHPSLYMRGLPSTDHPEIDHDTLEVFLPLIITPVLNKAHDTHPTFRHVWEQALEVLRTSERLIVMGYSFPPTDLHVRRLLREAFASHRLDALTVVNPDTSVVSTARDLCNFRAPVVSCRNVEEYVSKEGV